MKSAINKFLWDYPTRRNQLDLSSKLHWTFGASTVRVSNVNCYTCLCHIFGRVLGVLHLRVTGKCCFFLPTPWLSYASLSQTNPTRSQSLRSVSAGDLRFSESKEHTWTHHHHHCSTRSGRDTAARKPKNIESWRRTMVWWGNSWKKTKLRSLYKNYSCNCLDRENPALQDANKKTTTVEGATERERAYSSTNYKKRGNWHWL